MKIVSFWIVIISLALNIVAIKKDELRSKYQVLLFGEDLLKIRIKCTTEG